MKKLLFIAIVVCILSCSSPGIEKKPIDQSKPYLKITLAFNTESYPRIVKKIFPQMALWVQEKGTGRLKTFFVTEKGAKNEWFGAKERPDAMPVWYGVIVREKQAERLMTIDSITGATPSGESHTILWQVPDSLKDKTIDLFLEANVSYDYNVYYRKDLPEKSQGFSGVNGQPSLIWMASIQCGGWDKEYTPEIIGHGHIAGSDHLIDKDLSHITTAKGLFHSIKVEYKKGYKKN